MPFHQRILNISNIAVTTPIDAWDEDDKIWVERLYCSVVELWDSMSTTVFSMGENAMTFLKGALEFVGRILVSKLDSPQLAKSMLLMLRDIACEMGERGANYVRSWSLCDR